MSFSSFGLAPQILKAIEALGFSSPTPIQVKSIPKIILGKDVLGIAQTGTGKTGAFLIPIVHKLNPFANNSTSPAKHPLRSIILAPTRELADQIFENAQSFTRETCLRVGVVFGGTNFDKQIDVLNRGVEILIATPGRLIDHIEQKNLYLDQVSILVLDEADRMLDMGFLPDLKKIIQVLPAVRQSLFFSATFSKEIRSFSKTILSSNYDLIQVSNSNSTANTVDQKIFKIMDNENKRERLLKILKKFPDFQILVFVNTKVEASKLAQFLIKKNILADSIHGNKSQLDRLSVLEKFKQKKIRVMVATDVAARGLDIEQLPVVVNFDIPFIAEDYIHRIGRTGRAGSLGVAISLMTDEDKEKILEIEKLTKNKIKIENLVLEENKKIDKQKKDSKNNLTAVTEKNSSFGKTIKTKKNKVLPILLTKFQK